MKHNSNKEQAFNDVISQYKEVIAKVCWLYSSSYSFDDLYQEVLINIWQGLDSFRGDAKISTWIYRTAINTCITWHRRNARHGGTTTLRLDDVKVEVPDAADSKLDNERMLQGLISQLGLIDKALVTLWLDEKPYDEIAAIMGISTGNVAVKMHRIKERLAIIAKNSGL